MGLDRVVGHDGRGRDRSEPGYRVGSFRRSPRGNLFGPTSPTSAAAMLITQRGIILRVTRTIGPGVIDLETAPTWKRVRIHGVPVSPYVGRGSLGMEKLREELEAENDWVKITAVVRWLGRTADVRTRYSEEEIEASSVMITFLVLGEATFSSLQKSGLRLLGRRYNGEAFEEERLDMFCGRCGRWGHIEARCTRDACYAFCAGEPWARSTDCRGFLFVFFSLSLSGAGPYSIPKLHKGIVAPLSCMPFNSTPIVFNAA